MKIRPITAIRDTNQLIKELSEDKEPIIFTKNGYASVVAMNPDQYDSLNKIALSKVDEKGVINCNKNFKEYDGFLRVSIESFPICLGNTFSNAEMMSLAIKNASANDIKILLFSELCLSGYSCGDLFFEKSLIKNVEKGISRILKASSNLDVIVVFGAPLRFQGKLFDCAVAIQKGKILAVIPKTNLRESERRYFSDKLDSPSEELVCGQKVILSSNLIFREEGIAFGVTFGTDLYRLQSNSDELVLNGANLILVLDAEEESEGNADRRKALLCSESMKKDCAYVYSGAGAGESTTDYVYGGHHLIIEDGQILDESEPFSERSLTSDIDFALIRNTLAAEQSLREIDVVIEKAKPKSLVRRINKYPFVPAEERMALSILRTQAKGLERRIKSIGCKKAVLGLSGGLDSALALIVTVETFKNLGYPLTDIYAYSLPAFGTTNKTKDNSENLAKSLGVTFTQVDLTDTLEIHLKKLGLNKADRSIAFENAQARERTQFLMDISNKIGAIQIGTGDLSELCLGWCTYNGDHMSMYGVNGSITKTCVKQLCKVYGDTHFTVKPFLDNILDTPISPELLPPDEDGNLVQLTEEKIGPYELHDFFIYHYLVEHQSIEKVYVLAANAFADCYGPSIIKKWLRVFIERFYSSQFKRSCMPDGGKAGVFSISPRGGLMLPSDLDIRELLKEIEELKV